MTDLIHLPKRLLSGTPLRNERMGEALVPKRLALPLLCSDALSSNALTVAVSVAAGVANGVAALPALAPHPVAVALAFLAVLLVVNAHGMAPAGGARPQRGEARRTGRAAPDGLGSPVRHGETNYLRVYIAQLRRKPEADPAHPRHILTEPGMVTASWPDAGFYRR